MIISILRKLETRLSRQIGLEKYGYGSRRKSISGFLWMFRVRLLVAISGILLEGERWTTKKN